MTLKALLRGVGISVMLPFGVFNPPLVVPHSEIVGYDTTWYLYARSCELTFRQVPEVKMILLAGDAEWLARCSGAAWTLHEGTAFGGPAGQIWRRMMNTALVLVVLTCGALALKHAF
ncbi:MAG: hypothetical protein AAFZ01_14715 [Pseudomonadota bacterium]